MSSKEMCLFEFQLYWTTMLGKYHLQLSVPLLFFFVQAAKGFNDIDLDPDEPFFFYGFELPFSLLIMVSVLGLGFCGIGLLRYFQVKNQKEYQQLVSDHTASSFKYRPFGLNDSLEEEESGIRLGQVSSSYQNM